MRFEPIRYLGLNAELLYELEGATNRFIDARTAIHSIALPVLVEGLLPIGKVVLRLNSGIFGGYILAVRSDGEDASAGLTRLDFGFAGGVGGDFKALDGRFTLDVRFQRSLRNLYDHDLTPDYVNTPTSFKSTFHLLLGFLY